MNVYLIEDDDGVTVFDAGMSDMAAPLAAAGARLGGIKRVVLGHADADHRGAAPGLEAPVYCHPAERAAAESSDLLPRLLGPLEARRDAGDRAVAAARRPGTAARSRSPAPSTEGDEVAGFRVVDLPGHAPGLIGLFRESDRLALVSDCFTRSTPRPGAGSPRTSRIPRSTRTSSRPGPRSASSPRSSRPRCGPATPIPSPATSGLQLARAAAAPA